MVRGSVTATVTFCPTALFAVTGSPVGVIVVGVIVVMVAGKVVVTAVRCAVEITVMALTSAAGSTVVEMRATAAGWPLTAALVVGFCVSTCVPGIKPESGCPNRRKAPNKSSRQIIATISARRGVRVSTRLLPT